MISAFGIEHLAKGLSPTNLASLHRVASSGAPGDARSVYAFGRLERVKNGQRVSGDIKRARSRRRVSDQAMARRQGAPRTGMLP